MKHIVSIEGMSCGHCAMRVKKALSELAGVRSAEVDLLAKRAEVEGEGFDANMLRGAVEKAGYEAVSILP
jgi:copper chaperone CopZ